MALHNYIRAVQHVIDFSSILQTMIVNIYIIYCGSLVKAPKMV